MPLYITSLNSGSNGNCYYVGNGQEAILVDVGISCRETEKRMQRLGLAMESIKAIFISHEHSDHIRGLSMLAHKYQLPVYITAKTLRGCNFPLDQHLVKTFSANVPVNIGRLKVTAFAKLHDAVEPHSFMVSGNGVNIGVFTDIGAPCSQLTFHFKKCHAAFFESNYDEEMLEKGRYPYYLKKRIRGGHGHLSNKQALEVFTANKPAHMKCLILAHLSNENNCPDLVHRLFSENANGTEIIVASRFNETPVYTIDDCDGIIESKRYFIPSAHPVQASLF